MATAPKWTVQPPKGLIKGDYYCLEERFPPYYPGIEGQFPADPGHLGYVEVIQRDGRMIFVELNEITAPHLLPTSVSKHLKTSQRLQLLAILKGTHAESRRHAHHGYGVC